MMRTHLKQRVRTGLLATIALLAAGTLPVGAENVFVTAYKGIKATDDVTPCTPSCNAGPVSVSGSAAASTASPAPVVPASNRRSKFGTGAGCSWSVTPTDIDLVPFAGTPNYHFSSLQHTPGVYAVYVTKGTSGNASQDLIVEMTATGGELADTNGVGQTAIRLAVFQASAPNNVWIPVGYITNSQADPTVTFTHVSGNVASTGGRWYMDAVWFEYLDPCRGVASEVGVGGPLAEGQTFVTVTGVSAGAVEVSVFADNQMIGSAYNGLGFAAGEAHVPCDPLVKGARISAVQSRPNPDGELCTSDPGPTGIVGGGANPAVTAFVACWRNAAYAGPAGASSSPPASGYPYMLGATNLIGSYNTAPMGGRKLAPGECWQTATFMNVVDDGIDMNTGLHVTNTDKFCSLEGLVFSIEAPNGTGDTGPYEIYVDAIMNGDTLIEGFEGSDEGAMVLFDKPGTATQPTAAATYLPLSDSSAVTQSYAFEGTNACRIRWQFADGSSVRWAHIRANASTSKQYPQIDASKPITVRYLVLPVGSSTAHKFNGTVGDITGHTPAYETGVNTLGVTVTGSGEYTYQWAYQDSVLPEATGSTLVLGENGDLTAAANGAYTVTVSDGVCTETRSAVVKVMPPIPTITSQPQHVVAQFGSSAPIMSVSADGHVPAGNPLTYQWRFNGVALPDQVEPTLSFPIGVDLAEVGSYDVVVSNPFGQVISRAATLDVVPEGVTAGTGTGLRGDYRTTRYPTNAFSGAATVSRVDPVIDFTWADGASPAANLGADNFSARWRGKVQALNTDTYTFYTVSDDGVRLWIDGQLLIDNWTLHAPMTNSTTINLTAMQQYDLTLEFFEGGVSAVAQLYWSGASGSVGFELVPTSQLYPAPAGPVAPPFRYTQTDATHLQLNWGVGQYNLSWSTNVAGPYDNVIYGVTSPYSIEMGTEPERYYRLQVE